VDAAGFVHFLRGCMTRLFDEGHTVKMTSAGPEITQEPIREKVEGALVVDLFDATRFNQKILDAPAVQLFSVRNCRLACESFPEYAQWLFLGTLPQRVMTVELLTRRARIGLLEMTHAALQGRISGRH
jgi:hypothetical protein